MKFNLGLVGLFLAVGLVSCGKAPEELQKVFDECKREFGISLKGPQDYDDPKVKCFVACYWKEEGTLVDDKVVPEKALGYGAKHLHKDPKFAKADVTDCANKANEGTDECEVVGAFHKCLTEKSN